MYRICMSNKIELTVASKALFLAYANDAGNWGGIPLVGGNVGGSRADAGNLTDLKKKGLLCTFESDKLEWVSFTPAGIDYALENGVTGLHKAGVL